MIGNINQISQGTMSVVLSMAMARASASAVLKAVMCTFSDYITRVFPVYQAFFLSQGITLSLYLLQESTSLQ